MFARFLVVVLFRPEINLNDSICEFELAAFPRALFNSDGDFRDCVGKSKLMSVLENSPPISALQHQHTGRSVVIIDGMAVVQSMGKPTWVRNGRDLASHFLEIIDSRSKECKSNNLSVDQMNTTQKEAGTRMILHAIDATERGAASLCIQSPDTDVLVLAFWKHTSLCEETSLVVGTGAKRQSILLGPLYNAVGGH